MSNAKLSKSPYKGTRDMYPEDMIQRNQLFEAWSTVAKKFGYEEYDTSLLEEAKLYKIKSGEELANKQLYNFKDKGDREIALRPEMTPSLARIVANKKNELALPLRLFNIGRFYRYEKPQKGRTREFFQLNLDILGVSSIEAEIEILQFINAVMEELEAPTKSYEIRINNRYLLDYLFEKILKIDDSQKVTLARYIDNYLKMEKDDFKEGIEEIIGDKSQKLLQYLEWDINDLEKIKKDSKGAQQLLELFEKAEKLNIKNLKFSPSIVRGLQYYTGTVIEMFELGSNNTRALLGGGRYDDLLEIFDEEKIHAVGLGWGDITMTEYMKNQNLLTDKKTEVKVYITLMDQKLYKKTNEIAQRLRKEGINTEVQLEEKKLSKQLKYASKKEIPYVIILGDDEVKKNKLVLKDMRKGEQKTLPLKRAIRLIKK